VSQVYFVFVFVFVFTFRGVATIVAAIIGAVLCPVIAVFLVLLGTFRYVIRTLWGALIWTLVLA
jgi:hypothetical protein